MGLIACPECGQGVSEHAPTCPHCGYPIRGQPDPLQQLAAASRTPAYRRPARPGSNLNRLVFLFIVAGLMVILAIYAHKAREDDPEGSLAAVGGILALAQLVFWVLVVCFVIWIIRRGVALGAKDADRKR
jgi:hypothetical protein